MGFFFARIVECNVGSERPHVVKPPLRKSGVSWASCSNLFFSPWLTRCFTVSFISPGSLTFIHSLTRSFIPRTSYVLVLCFPFFRQIYRNYLQVYGESIITGGEGKKAFMHAPRAFACLAAANIQK